MDQSDDGQRIPQLMLLLFRTNMLDGESEWNGEYQNEDEDEIVRDWIAVDINEFLNELYDEYIMTNMTVNAIGLYLFTTIVVEIWPHQ